MNVAALLLLYSGAVLVLGPGLLVGFTHHGVAPRLGLITWLAVLFSLLGSWLAAGGFLLAELVRAAGHPGELVLRSCMGQLHAVAAGQHGLVVQVGLWALAAAVAAALGLVGWRFGRALTRARAATREHARLARLAGRPVSGLDDDRDDGLASVLKDGLRGGRRGGAVTVVLDAAQPAVYCVAGRPRTIVVTTAALATLRRPELAAVLDHERAHLAGRHHLALAFTRALARLLPRFTLFTTAAGEVARLVEMCADDAAARRHGRGRVLDALLALVAADPARLPRSTTWPAPALGASGVAVLTRAERLERPAPPARRLQVCAQLGTAAALALTGPLLAGLLASAGLAICGPMGG